MMKTNTVFSFLGIFLLITFFSACVKDTDFGQADDVLLTPVVDLNLIYFDLPVNTFYDTITSSPVLTVRDTTAIPFLNDQGIQSSLMRAEFYFKITNSIQREFNVVFEFLNDLNNVKYTIQIPVEQGSVSNSVVTEYLENVEGLGIRRLTKAEKIAVSVTIPSYNEDLDGAIKLESKTTYYLEF